MTTEELAEAQAEARRSLVAVKFTFLDDDYYSNVTIKHESGHAQQSKRLGIFYLIIIGLPSISGNIFSRLFHKKWEPKKRILWHYNLPWEKWADKLGGVRR